MKKRICDMISSFKEQSVLKKAYLILVLLLSISIFVSATLFIVSCSTIYFTGGSTPFSREVVNYHLARILPANIITLVLLVAAGIISILVEPPKPVRYPLSKKVVLERIKSKLPRETSVTASIIMEGERKHRRLVTRIALIACALFALVSLIFILNPNAYTLENVNTDIAYSVIIGSVATLLGFAAWYVRGVLVDASYVREADAVREEIKAISSSPDKSKLATAASSDDESELDSLSRRDGHIHVIVRLGVLAISIAFIILGVFNGGMDDVLGKAVRICTECIGLG